MALALFLHNLLRWLLLVFMGVTLFRSARGHFGGRAFTKADNFWRHWTATLSHIQLMAGMWVISKSAVALAFWQPDTPFHPDLFFFGFLHPFLMLSAILIITIISAKAKRKATDAAKHRLLFFGFLLALILIFVAIPWPFSPFVSRPFIRTV